MTSWQPGRFNGPSRMCPNGGGAGPAGAGTGTGVASRTTPGRYNEDMEQLIFRMHQLLIDELDADQIAAMPAEERRQVVEQASEQILRRELPNVGGITRDQIVSRVVDEVVAEAARLSLAHRGMTPSPIEGAEGNREFLVHVTRDAPPSV